MKLLKKIIRKLYHLIWFLSLFILFCPFVFATNGEINGSIYSSDISASAQAEWFDVNHTSMTTSLISNVGFSPYFQASSRYNSYLSFNVYLNFQSNVIYSLTIYVNAQNNTNISAWNNNIATGTWNGGANNNNKNATCRAYVYSNTNTYNIKYGININEDGTSQATTGAIYLTFSPSCEGSYINIPVAFDNPSGNMYFYGYHLEPLGLSDGLTTSDVQSVISSSGLATARSVQDVQSSVNEVKSSLGTLTDAQQETTNTIKDETAPTVDLSDISLSSTTPISDLVTLPLSLLNSYLTAFSGSCSNYTLPLPFNHSVTLTCFTLSDVIGSNVAYIIDMAICLYMAYEIVLLFIKIFEDMTSLSDTYTNWVKRGRY